MNTVDGNHPAIALEEPPIVDLDDRAEEVSVDTTDHAQTAEQPSRFRNRSRAALRLAAYGILPALAMIFTLVAGYMKWQYDSSRESLTAAKQSVAVATDGAIALLSYRPDNVEKDLVTACDRLTGTFRDSYSQLIRDVVIPGAKQKQISAVATVPAAASVTASRTHAEVLVFVDQTITIGKDAPTDTASSIRITLDNVGNRWLISGFEPI